MTEDARPKPKLVTPSDALDLSDLWLDPGLGDGITESVRHSIPLGKPRDFFRMHPDPAYRRLVEIYKHKTEDAIGVLRLRRRHERHAGGGSALHAGCVHLSRRLPADMAVAAPQRRRT